MEFGLNGDPLSRTNRRVEGPAAPFGHRFDAVLIGSDVSRGAASVAAAGGCAVAAFGWGEEIRMAGKPVLVIEAQGEDEQTIADAFPAIAEFAAERGCKVVAAFDLSSIDAVTASLLGAGIELLCEPDLPERIAALLRASNGAHEPEPVLREENGEHGAAAFGVEPPREPAAEPRDLRRAIRSRRLRDEFFMPGLFADPAWDMLLDLYAAELEDQPVSVSSLCIAAAVAPTTALRWIARMRRTGSCSASRTRTTADAPSWC